MVQIAEVAVRWNIQSYHISIVDVKYTIHSGSWKWEKTERSRRKLCTLAWKSGSIGTRAKNTVIEYKHVRKTWKSILIQCSERETRICSRLIGYFKVPPIQGSGFGPFSQNSFLNRAAETLLLSNQNRESATVARHETRIARLLIFTQKSECRLRLHGLSNDFHMSCRGLDFKLDSKNHIHCITCLYCNEPETLRQGIPRQCVTVESPSKTITTCKWSLMHQRQWIIGACESRNLKVHANY